ncbi:MAG: rhomboid family intramembrane serine protease [Chthoniobacterales bacterium]
MFGVTTSDDYQPVTWMGRYPVHVTTLLVGVHVACAVLACFVMAFGAGSVLNLFLFDSAFVLQAGQLWRLLTYAFVHSPSGLLWFAIEMYMLFIFGREVERFVGRRAFIVLYAALLLAPTLVLSIWGFRERTGLAGSPAIHMGVFIAFATIYPHVELLLRIMAKWVALGLAGINTLMLLADRAWPNVAVLWVSIFVAFFFIRLRGVGPELVWWESIKTIVRPKPKFHVVPRPTARRVVEPDNVHDSIDPVLDKISKHGINSLTPTERRTLDRARARLLNKTK